MTPLELYFILSRSIAWTAECVAARPPVAQVTLVAAPVPRLGVTTAFWLWLDAHDPTDQDLLSTSTPDSTEELVGLVRRMRSVGESASELAPELARSSAPTPEMLFEMLASEVVPGSGDHPPQRLSEAQRDLVSRSLALRSRPAVLAALEAWFAASDPEERAAPRRAWIEVLGAVGEDAELDRLLEWGATEQPELPRSERARLRRALGGLCARSARPFDVLSRHWTRLRDDFVRATLEASGDAGDPRALPYAGEILSARLQLVPVVLAQIPHMVGDWTGEPLPQLVAAVAAHLDPDAPNRCSAAAQALGALEDPSAARPLVELLDEESGPVRAAAHWALRRVGGVDLPLSVGLWRHWLERESSWYEREFTTDLARLRSGSIAARAAALKSLAQHRLYRHEIAPLIAELIPELEGVAGKLACDALVQLGSRRAVEGLRAALLEGGPHAQAVRGALESLGETALTGTPAAYDT